MTPEILAVVGSLVAMVLTINAYFIKQLVDSINQVKIQTAILVERDTHKESRIAGYEKDIHEIFSRLRVLEKELK